MATYDAFCPEGHMIRSELDTVWAEALITAWGEADEDDHREIDWNGYTEVSWESQEPITTEGPDGRIERQYVCEQGDPWRESLLLFTERVHA